MCLIMEVERKKMEKDGVYVKDIYERRLSKSIFRSTSNTAPNAVSSRHIQEFDHVHARADAVDKTKTF